MLYKAQSSVKGSLYLFFKMLQYFKFYVAGIAASVTLFVHIAYIRNYWEVNPYPLQRLMLAGCFVQLVGVCGFVTYLTLAIVNKQGEQFDTLRKMS